MREEILNLGKLLVDELGLQSSVDTLSRWMAHYIAEQMQIIESTENDDKKLAEEKCFETILKLWKHMSYYKSGMRPLENFEPIFQALNRLNPDNQHTYYFNNEFSLNRNDDTSDNDVITQYLSLATKIDETARVWLKFIFQSAAEVAVDDKMKRWIEAALPLSDNAEASLIVQILSNYEPDGYEDTLENKRKLLEKRIEQIEGFREFNEELISMYKKEMGALVEGS